MSDRQPDLRLPHGIRLVRPLGAGAMGEVWVGDSIREGEVAVKFLAEAVRHDPSAVQRFEREWKMASSIDSPHVVRMIARGEMPDGLPYIVMELLKGESLEERLDRYGTLDPEPAMAVFRQVASALDRAHVQGIVHRDIKPENILLCGPDSRVKILDFGLAKPLSREGFSLTKTGVLMGTPFYMAPEQINQGGRDFDGRADDWALAAVAYRTLLGVQPFDADSLHALVLSILKGQYVPVAEAGGDAGLETFFARAFALDRGDRFASATAMIEALGRVLEGGLIDEPTMLDVDAPDGEDDDDWEGAQPTREYAAGQLLQEVDEPIPPVSTTEPATMRWHDTGPPPPHASSPSPPSEVSRGRRWLPFVVGANLVALGVLAVVLTSRTPAPVPPPSPMLSVSTSVPLAPPVARPSPAATTIPPPTAMPSSPPPTSTDTRTEPAKDPEAALLTIECEPVCIVIVDGVSHGVSPLREGRFRPGKHEVKAYRDDRSTKSVTLDVARGQHLIHRFELDGR